MRQILQSPVSAVHLTAAVLALVLGTYVWVQPKGTRWHRRIGYAYVASMVVLLTTAFGIYHLFGRFGIVHWGAVGAGLSLVVGVGSAVLRWPAGSWRLGHYFGMGGSLTGLYTTFAVEATYRFFPAPYFWWATVGTGSVVIAVGVWRLWSNRPLAGLSEETKPTPLRPVIG